MKIILIAFFSAFITFGQAQSLTGTWKGGIHIMGTDLPIVFHLEKQPDGTLTGTWDSPAQKVFGLKFSTLNARGDSLLATIKFAGAKYAAKFIPPDSIAGTWTQAGADFPLNLKKSSDSVIASEGIAKEEVKKLPEEKELDITTRDGIKIHGTLLFKDKKNPIVLIIAGSGPTDRNGNNPLGVTSAPYALLAHDFYADGIGTYRYDKRGIGKSVLDRSKYKDVIFEDFVNDAVDIVNDLKRQGFSQIFIAGHSEGSLIGMVAAQKTDFSGLISISGAGMRADRILEKQISEQMKNVPDSAVQRIFASIRAGKIAVDLPKPLENMFPAEVQPYLSSWFRYDPVVEIKKVKCPVLLLNGTCDVQIGVENATALFNASRKGRIEIIKGMTHLLKDAGKNCEHQQQTYTDVAMPLSKELVPDIEKFIIDVDNKK